MHKKIKLLIATTLVFGTVSCIIPADKFTLGSVTVQASEYSKASTGELSSLDLTWGGTNEIKLRESYSGDEVKLSEDTEYYVSISSISKFNVDAEARGSGYIAKVFTSSSKTEEGEDSGAEVKISSSYKNIYIRTYKSEEDYEEAYDNGDVSDCEKTYVIHVQKTSGVSETEEDREYAYLDGIHLSDGYVNFSKNQTSYNVNVDEDVDTLTIKATPDDEDDYVEVDGAAVYEDDDFEKTVKLDKGENTIEIYVEHSDGDDEEETTYTLNVYRGKAENSPYTTITNNSNYSILEESSQTNAWQRVNGKWKYIDGTGSAVKNQWWFDRNTGINYYLDADGNRTTGWFNNNNNWYYFDENGQMKTGWVNINKNWYFLNQSGAMKMGWLEDSTGNWYYLEGSGAMKTGWVENSDGKWYYMDSTGKMVRNTNFNGNSFGADGVLIQ